MKGELVGKEKRNCRFFQLYEQPVTKIEQPVSFWVGRKALTVVNNENRYCCLEKRCFELSGRAANLVHPRI